MSDEALKELERKNKEMVDRIAELSKGGMDDEARKRLVFLEDDHKKAIDRRDKALKEKKEAEEKRLLEQGEHKTLAEQRAKDLDEAAKNSDELKAKIAAYEARDEEELKALAEKVPEAFKEDLADTTTPLDARLKLAKKLIGQKVQSAGYRPPGEPPPESLKDRYDAAVKSGDVSEQIALKRQMFESKE